MIPLELNSAQRLQALRELDVFHDWESIEDHRLCRRCGRIISGRQIRILSGVRDDRPAHLECPTEGCLSVPLEWIVLEPAKDSVSHDFATHDLSGSVRSL